MTGVATSEAAARLRLRVAGLVQGVGFRPYVHRLATELGLTGHVGNDTRGVFIEVEGTKEAAEEFVRRLVTEAPGPARIDEVLTRPMAPTGATGFTIVESRGHGTVRTFVSPDIATCGDCLAELFDPADRRARYPFTNCTNCGPRFTITLSLPYDRPNTTMRGFALCEACASEYHDPADRRFHAQPIACADCGPRLWLEHRAGSDPVVGSDAAIAAAQAALARGRSSRSRVSAGTTWPATQVPTPPCSGSGPGSTASRSRSPSWPVTSTWPARWPGSTRRKRRSSRRPNGPSSSCAGARARPKWLISALVAPGNPRLGVLLPYTPLHHLLFAPVPECGDRARVPDVLVMTSGNLTDEPICYEDDDARRRLGTIADAWLLHDRPIHVPCDDSVLEIDPGSGSELPLRRSRGYAPLPLRLPFSAGPTLAVGGELKNTFCLAAGRDAFMSQHIGDMGSLETWAAFERSTRQLAGLYGIRTPQLAADAHPGYQTKRWAEDASPRPVAEVQHHHAHIASVMAEHGVPAGRRVIGIAFDGTGFGTDGTIWGGEILVAGYGELRARRAPQAVPLPGGDAAIRRPCRTALAHLWAAGIEWAEDLPPASAVSTQERAVLARQLERGTGCVATSSMGRLFDAVSSLLGLRHLATYEAEAALCLQWAAEEALSVGVPALPYRFDLTGTELDPSPVLRALVDDLRRGADSGAMAAGFHGAVARVIGDVVERQRAARGHRRGRPERRRLPERAAARTCPPRARDTAFPGPDPPGRATERRRPRTGTGGDRGLPCRPARTGA